MDDLDCTCNIDYFAPHLSGRGRYPCPVHGMTFATKNERLEMLEERVSKLEQWLARVAERDTD